MTARPLNRFDAPRRVAFWLAAVAMLPLAGCSPPPRVGLHGHVTLDGQPLDEAAILFVPLEAGRKKTGAAVVRGAYELAPRHGLAPGTYRVEIKDNPPLGQAGEGGLQAADHGVKTRRVLPPQYSQDSPWQLTVNAQTPAEQNFDLVSKR